LNRSSGRQRQRRFFQQPPNPDMAAVRTIMPPAPGLLVLQARRADPHARFRGPWFQWSTMAVEPVGFKPLHCPIEAPRRTLGVRGVFGVAAPRPRRPALGPGRRPITGFRESAASGPGGPGVGGRPLKRCSQASERRFPGRPCDGNCCWRRGSPLRRTFQERALDVQTEDARAPPCGQWPPLRSPAAIGNNAANLSSEVPSLDQSPGRTPVVP